MNTHMSLLEMIRARCDRARLGPWETERDNHIDGWLLDEELLVVRDRKGAHIAYVTIDGLDDGNADAAFVAGAWEDVLRLLEEVNRLHDACVTNGIDLEDHAVLSTAQLERIRARFCCARPGPWYFVRDDRLGQEPVPPRCRIVWVDNADLVYVTPGGLDNGNADAAFIANARRDTECLLDQVDILRAALVARGIDPGVPAASPNAP